ncbi:MAG: cell division protein SepF [Oscillibacter sp.]|nr:cell division protein SepF [Oscillibacter sp.]
MSFVDSIKRMISPLSDEDDEFEDVFDDQDSPFLDERPRGSVVDSRRGKVVNIHATTQLKVVLVKPERFEAASEIADHLKEKRTVVVNLESTHKDIARRLIDFLSGVAYASEGKIKKVAANTYMITPYSVDIQGDLIDELESNGMYF